MIKPKRAPYGTTTKDPDTTIADINRMLRSFGIENIQWTTLWEKHYVEVKIAIPLQDGKNIMVKIVPPAFTAKRRTWNEKRGRYEIVEAPNWPQCLRLLYWWLKVKIEAIAYGLREVEEEFLSDVIVHLPSGQETTVGEAIRPALASGSESILDLPRLPGPKEDSY